MPTGPHRVCHLSISEAQAFDFKDAWHFAIQIGRRPTLFVTIHWNLAPSSRFGDPMSRLAAVRQRMKSWLRRLGVPFVWLEIRENPRGLGEHVHWAVHVPLKHRKAFGAAVARWVAQDADEIDSRAVHVRPITQDWWTAAEYMLKGGEAEVQRIFATDRFRKHKSQGRIFGPRIRVSHSIGRTARATAGMLATTQRAIAA